MDHRKALEEIYAAQRKLRSATSALRPDADGGRDGGGRDDGGRDDGGRDDGGRDDGGRDDGGHSPTRGSRVVVDPATLPNKVTGEKMFQPTGSPEVIKDTLWLGNYRSCLHTNNYNQEHWDFEIENCVFSSESLNGPGQNWQGMGTYWITRLYGTRNFIAKKVTVVDHFGKSYAGDVYTSKEGHVYYNTNSPMPGSLVHLEDNYIDVAGGHGCMFTTAWDDPRAINTERSDRAVDPQDGGKILIDHCTFKNSDISPYRGAYCLNFVDSFCDITISNTVISMNHPLYSKHKDDKYNSRAAVDVSGYSANFSMDNCFIQCEEPSDRNMQVDVEGPPVVTLENTTFECREIRINDPYGDKPHTFKSNQLNIDNCDGDALVFVNGAKLGIVSNLSGNWDI